MTDTRKYWLDTMLKIVSPVLDSLSRECLRSEMPVRGSQPKEVYQNCTYLEAFGRTMAGVAPWLGCQSQTGEEERLRAQYAQMARRCLAVCVDSASPDKMNFTPSKTSGSRLWTRPFWRRPFCARHTSCGSLCRMRSKKG